MFDNSSDYDQLKTYSILNTKHRMKVMPNALVKRITRFLLCSSTDKTDEQNEESHGVWQHEFYHSHYNSN